MWSRPLPDNQCPKWYTEHRRSADNETDPSMSPLPPVPRTSDIRQRWVDHTLIAVALGVGALVRLIGNENPFSSSDHAELASIVTFFYPRNIRSLIDTPPIAWHMLTSVHGSLPPLIATVCMTIVGSLGISISEWWWNFPFALAGIATIYIGSRFTSELAGRRAGLIAAYLLALLPIHAVTSRASGLAHITLMGLCQLIAIQAFTHYYTQPNARSARNASLALSLALLVDLFSPILLVLLLAVGLLAIVPNDQANSWQRWHLARQAFSAHNLLRLPLVVICFNGLIMVAYAMGYLPQGGLFSRLFQGSDRQPGLFLTTFWANGSVVMGVTGFSILVALAILGIPSLIRLERQAIPLLWACAYLLPFVLFTRANFAGYLLMGSVGLTLHGAIILSKVWERGSVAQVMTGLIILLLVTTMGLHTLAITFGVGPLANDQIAQGGVFPDQGLKSAAWWVRDTNPNDALVFADSTYEPYQLWYYLRRPMIALTDAPRPEAVYELLATAPTTPHVYLIPPERTDLLLRYAHPTPTLRVTITAHARPVLLVYTYTDGTPPIEIEVASGNQRFDQEFGGWREMFSLTNTTRHVGSASE